ncbi:MAG: hypothetical protein IAE90_01045 [Ignavibacteria bacterium]|nr:hypothetical protein [Ignavibacteria bacterium]
MDIEVPISPGELIDKMTILEIKLVKIKDSRKLVTVKNELKILSAAFVSLMKRHKPEKAEVLELKKKLFIVNRKLWNIENVIRSLEAKKDFGTRFVEHARKVYITNDKRSAIKLRINALLGSGISEVKEYSRYR